MQGQHPADDVVVQLIEELQQQASQHGAIAGAAVASEIVEARLSEHVIFEHDPARLAAAVSDQLEEVARQTVAREIRKQQPAPWIADPSLPAPIVLTLPARDTTPLVDAGTALEIWEAVNDEDRSMDPREVARLRGMTVDRVLAILKAEERRRVG